MLDIKFEGQKPNEDVVALFHKSHWSYLKSYFLSIFLIILPIVVYLISHSAQISVLFFIVCWASAIFSIGRIWYLWTNNIYLVTNIRVIALMQNGIFDRKFQESYLDSVCQVVANIKGMTRSMLDFGDVLVQTEAEMWLIDVEHPNVAKNAIFEALENHRKLSGSNKSDIVFKD